MIRLASILLLLAGPAGVQAGFLPKGTPASAGSRNIVLIYNSAPHHLDWQASDFRPLLGRIAPDGRQTNPFFDTFLVLPLVAPSGRGFTVGFGSGPSNLLDWQVYLDEYLFGGRNHLRRLDLAAREAQQALGSSRLRWKVVLTLPYPDVTQRSFGRIQAGTPYLDFAIPAHRLTAARWYVEQLGSRWNAGGYVALDLVGVYWLHEAVSDAADRALLPQVASDIHGAGLRFFWIPWYNAPGATAWRDFGFDAVIHQPNYFFTSSLPYRRLTDAIAISAAAGMGLEVELDERAISSSDYRQRYRDYLAAFRAEGVQRGALTAWYMGVGTLNKAAVSTDPEVRAIYDDTWNFVAGSGLPGDVDKTRTVDVADVALIVGIAHGGVSGNDASVDAANADVDGDGRVTLTDAARLLRHVTGLSPEP